MIVYSPQRREPAEVRVREGTKGLGLGSVYLKYSNCSTNSKSNLAYCSSTNSHFVIVKQKYARETIVLGLDLYSVPSLQY